MGLKMNEMSTAHAKYEKKKRRIRANGIFYAAISSASFGFSPVFTLALLVAGLSSFDTLAYRWSTAAAVLMAYALYRNKTLRISSREEAWKIIILSILRAVTSITLLYGYANISSGIASTINFMYPVVVTACMMLFFGENKSKLNILAVILAIIGVYLMASGDGLRVPGGNTALGLTCSIISAFTYAAYFIVMKRSNADKIEALKFTTWIMMLSAAYFIAGCFISDGSITLVTNPVHWIYILGLGLWATMVSNFTGVKAVRRIGPTLTSILGALQPLTAVLLGVLFLDEHLGPKTIIGIILILVTVSIIVLNQNSSNR